jgi:3-hydroxybutyryl-CoA dehydratase
METNDYSLQNLRAGSPLPELQRELNQKKINCYAEAVSDFNPIHVDPEFAARTSFGGTIAHGMLILAYISEIMEIVFGEHWPSSGKLAVRFKAPAKSTDTITVKGKVDSVAEKDGKHIYKCIVDCHNQDGLTIIVGDTEISVPDKH